MAGYGHKTPLTNRLQGKLVIIKGVMGRYQPLKCYKDSLHGIFTDMYNIARPPHFDFLLGGGGGCAGSA